MKRNSVNMMLVLLNAPLLQKDPCWTPRVVGAAQT